MIQDFRHKQTASKPLFPAMVWSRPENRQQAGKLLIIGGNLHGFAAPAEAYAESLKAGIGVSRVLLPSAIQKVVGPSIENGEFAASTPSGSFSQKAWPDLLEWCKWADGALFAGDLGRNSETAILVEKFLAKCEVPTILTRDAVDYIVSLPHAALERPNTTLVLSLSQLQRLGTAAKFEQALTFGMDLLRLVEWLHLFSERYAAHIIVKHLDNIFVAVNGEVSNTKLNKTQDIWRLRTATHAAVWWLQNPSKPFEALSTAVLQITE
jgi:NAD(P)H-hydrate repair Nnr-like enzyme with NAD(P)H-hydrate dehydratase domain